jgi:hypothetical protein
MDDKLAGLADDMIEFVLKGLDDNSIQMTKHRRDLFDAIYREYVHYC